ncbi:hypothetical protein PVAND_013654 [Polypedilum vanderplanki]|uniref:Peptidyl-prolyl cis-trans isomerase n=1 Tax=Polypedilum vanderplanki TaxID=319348 RepID=A0A9J6CRB2_POLVA|nr:hypothetical protein PVAND_013654 [Polypedilum vanderplanki]
MSVVIETTVGDITVDLYLKERPKTCLNFLKLCKLKYYNFNLFHTIEPNFLAQTGDPTGDGNKGESVWGVIEGPKKKFFEAEQIPKVLHSDVGLISMVSVDGFVGSQFFFTLGTDLTSLDGIHSVFGEVVEGHEVLRQLNEAIVDDKHRPYKDIRITHTVILDDPFSDPRGFREPNRSPSPSAERLKNGRIGADEDIDDTEGKTEAEIQEMLEEREAKARATILEIIGDLPDAECAPPENVLFVCKLNPVTNDDDLQIIFSRFGKIKSCEVIRDKQTGDSLQYAFIEFEDQKSCESAYFKMDNVLIDDRRIHVDFSQSVSKIKWRGKGNYTIYDDDNKNDEKKKSDRRSRERDRGRRIDEKRRSRSHDKYRYERYDSRRNREREVNRREDNYKNDRRIHERRSRSPKRRHSPERRKNYDSRERRRSRSRSRNNYHRKDSSPKRDRNESSRHNHRRTSSSTSSNSEHKRKYKKKSSKKDHRRSRSSSSENNYKSKKSRH